MLSQLIQEFSQRRADELDLACSEAMEEYGCAPHELALEIQWTGTAEVVTILGARPRFKKLQFEFSK